MDSFKIIKPRVELAPFVKQYWILRTGGGGIVTERTVPTGSVSLIFHRGQPMDSSLAGRKQPAAFLSGLSSTYSDLATNDRVDMISAVFHPFGAGEFFRAPLAGFRNADVPLEDMDEAWIRDLGDYVRDENDDAVAVRIIEEALLGRLAARMGYNYGRMAAAVEVASREPGHGVADLASTACLSQKQFGRIFADYIGTTPKEFLRIVRFQRALHLLQNEPAANFAQLAFEAGYYDQPHMIREFKSFSGYTPAEYLAACAPYSDYFSE